MIIPFCVGCKKTASQIKEYIAIAEDEGISPADYVREEEGTYNPVNGHFLCTDCYVKAGMPSLPHPKQWKAP